MDVRRKTTVRGHHLAIMVAASVLLGGCRNPNGQFDPFSSLSASRIPPPPTGSIGRPDGYQTMPAGSPGVPVQGQAPALQPPPTAAALNTLPPQWPQFTPQPPSSPAAPAAWNGPPSAREATVPTGTWATYTEPLTPGSVAATVPAAAQQPRASLSSAGQMVPTPSGTNLVWQTPAAVPGHANSPAAGWIPPTPTNYNYDPLAPGYAPAMGTGNVSSPMMASPGRFQRY